MASSSSSSAQPSAGEKAGSCHCGAVTVRIEGAPLCSHLCHCTTCQQLSGGPFAMYVDFKAEQVHLDDPTGAVRFYHPPPSPPPPAGGRSEEEDRKQMLGRASCAVCAATVQCRNPNLPALTAVPAGVLACDAPARVPPPAVEFWCRRRQSWLGPTGARLAYLEQPRDEAGLRECMEAFGLV